ncbi:hypothetical protein IJ182_03905 [bacterium]|nr:hypothetical protein [bacterium]
MTNRGKIIYYFSIIIIFLISLEFYLFNKYRQEYLAELDKTNFNLSREFNYKLTYSNFVNTIKDKYFFRQPVNFGNNHNIITFGCSFAFGSSLNVEQTFWYKLAQRTGSSVTNRAYPGIGNAFMLYQTENKNPNYSLDLINGDVDTIIYIYIPDHLYRLNYYYWANLYKNVLTLRYKLVKNQNETKLKEDKLLLPPLHVFFITKSIYNYIANQKNSDKNKAKNYELLFKIFEESHKNLIKRYPNSKFIIIEYNNTTLMPYKETLKKAGWELYSTNDIIDENIDLNDEKYHFKNDCHPTEEAWDVIVDGIIKNNII